MVKGLKRSVGFLARATSLYGTYKVAELSIAVQSRLRDWSPSRVEQAWHEQNERGAQEVRRIAEDFGGYYLKCGQWLGARPDLVPMEWVET